LNLDISSGEIFVKLLIGIGEHGVGPLRSGTMNSNHKFEPNASPGGHSSGSLLIGIIQNDQWWIRGGGFFWTIVSEWFIRKSLGATPNEKKAADQKK